MLKIKLLHRELYDAICMYQGRNPLFDFSQIKNMSAPQNAIKTFNPGPIFLYKKGDLTPKPNSVFTDMSSKSDYCNYSNWLNTFKADLTSVSSDNPFGTNAFLDLNNIPDITNLMSSKFKNAEYKLTDISLPVLQVEENTKNLIENHIIIQFKVKSVFVSAKENAFDYEIKKSIKISREDDLR